MCAVLSSLPKIVSNLLRLIEKCGTVTVYKLRDRKVEIYAKQYL
jgi:hypothetical protein